MYKCFAFMSERPNNFFYGYISPTLYPIIETHGFLTKVVKVTKLQLLDLMQRLKVHSLEIILVSSVQMMGMTVLSHLSKRSRPSTARRQHYTAKFATTKSNNLKPSLDINDAALHFCFTIAVVHTPIKCDKQLITCR